MAESQAEYLCQNVKHGCSGSVRGPSNASNRGSWHLLECILNSKLNTESGMSVSPSGVFDIFPAYEELLAPIVHLRVRESIITV
jgi:hypothetical protein